jgi:tetratricopeptide (TPR) repeat protein
MSADLEKQEIFRRSAAFEVENRLGENEALLESAVQPPDDVELLAVQEFPDDVELSVLAAIAKHSSDPEEAGRLALRAADLAGDDPRLLANAAYGLFRVELYQEARDLTTLALSGEPDDPVLVTSLMHLAAKLALVADQADKAEELFRDAFKLDPEWTQNAREYAELLEGQGRSAEALTVVEEALSHHSDERGLLDLRDRLWTA